MSDTPPRHPDLGDPEDATRLQHAIKHMQNGTHSRDAAARSREPGPLCGVAITTPVAEEIAHAAHQALRAFVAVMSGQKPSSFAWSALLPAEAASDRIRHVQQVAVGTIGDNWGQGSPSRNRVYSLVVLGILALGEEAGGNADGASARRVDLAARVLGWLNDGEAMRLPTFGPILQALSEIVNGDDDGAAGTARRAVDAAKQHALVVKALAPHAHMHEQPHEVIGRILGERTTAQAAVRSVVAAIHDLPAAIRDVVDDGPSQHPAEVVKRMGGALRQAFDDVLTHRAAEEKAAALVDTIRHEADEALSRLRGELDGARRLLDGAQRELERAVKRDQERAECIRNTQAILERELQGAPVTVPSQIILATPVLSERVRMVLRLYGEATQAAAQASAGVARDLENFRPKALAWEELILWITNNVPQPWVAIVDAHGPSPERWKLWPDQVRRMVRAILDEERRQREDAATAHEELEQHEAKGEAGYGEDTAYPDEALLLSALRSARARLAGVDDGFAKVIDTVVAMAEGEQVVEQDEDETEGED